MCRRIVTSATNKGLTLDELTEAIRCDPTISTEVKLTSRQDSEQHYPRMLVHHVTYQQPVLRHRATTQPQWQVSQKRSGCIITSTTTAEQIESKQATYKAGRLTGRHATAMRRKPSSWREHQTQSGRCWLTARLTHIQ